MDRGGTWLDKEAGTRLKSGREQHDGHRILEARAEAERTRWALTLRAPPNRSTPSVDVQDAGDRGSF